MRVFLGDLAHYTVKLTNNHTPINIGFIASFLKQKMPDIEIELFKNPDELYAAIDKNPPDILGLSNYCWCQSVSENALRHYKEVKPDGVAVWGGPNFPMNELHKAKQYLMDRPYVDFYIPYEGEKPFYLITKLVSEHGNDVKKLQKEHSDEFLGSFFLVENRDLVGKEIGTQIPELDTIPSPYLEGWMDKFLTEGLHAMFETQRGCPYKCTFCHTGLDYYKRGRSFSLDRCKEEIEYITNFVDDPSVVHLYITDSNFGMWPQDLEFSQWLAEFYEKTGFPLSFGTSTGKGRIELVLKTVMSHPKLMLTNSVQSLDKSVLNKIQRRNLPLDQLQHSQKELDEQGKLSQPEIILGLPYETRESHLETFRRLIHDVGANIIYQYTLMLLPGTEIYTDKLREECQYMVKYRIIPTAFGEYGGEKAFEIEEVSVATKDLSYEDYLEMREMFFFVHNVYSNFIYRPLVRFLLYLEEDIIDFFLYMIKKRKTLGEAYPNKVLSDYIRDTEEELFETKQDVIDYYSDEQNYKDLVDGRKGINLTHTYRTLVFLNSIEWVGFITESFREYIQRRYADDAEVMNITENIVKHLDIQAECQHRYFNDRGNIPTEDNPIRIELDYDIPTIFTQKVNKESFPKFHVEKSRFSYYMKDEAIDYIKKLPENQRTIDLALVVLRMDQSYIFPVYKKETGGGEHQLISSARVTNQKA